MIDYKAEWEANQDPIEPPGGDVGTAADYRPVTMEDVEKGYREASAGRHYVERNKAEFDALLVDRLRFRVVDLKGTNEIVYQRDGVNAPYSVRVYSSLRKGTGRTRDCGDDAIRVVMVSQESGHAMKIMGEGKKSKAGRRINRTKGAMNNLERRVKEYLLMGTRDYLCPKCGRMMAVRSGRNGKFLGCTHSEYDVEDGRKWCGGTRNAPDWVK